MKSFITAALVLAVLVGCTEAQPPATTDGRADVVDGAQTLSIYEQAVAAEGRTDADRERDAGRKPAEVLEFFAIEPGMSILDMFSGGGYYTELLSHVVGPEGRVVAHTNSAYA